MDTDSVVVDSSVWIDFFADVSSPQVRELKRLTGKKWTIVGDIVLHEVLRGFPDDRERRKTERAMRRFRVLPMLNTRLAILAARNYCRLQQEGITIATADLIIGTFCIAHNFQLLHADEDFGYMEKHLHLRSRLLEDCVREPMPVYLAAA